MDVTAITELLPHSISMPLQIALLMTVGVACQWLGWRTRLPAILFLLLVGIALGPVSELLDPDKLLGDKLFPVVSLGVAIILFEGALTLKLTEIKDVGRVIRNLTSLGVLISMLVMATGAHYIAGMPVNLALLFGALVSVTGPTVVVPMLRSLSAPPRVANILRWEGIIVDPVGALLAVLIFEAIITGHQSDSVIAFFKLIGAGFVLGAIGALIMRKALQARLIPEYLTNFFSISLVLLVFSMADQIEHESGLVAVTVMGMMLANMRGVNMASILDFKEHLTVLLISMLFILLAARMDLNAVENLGWIALAILLLAQFVARPLSAWVSCLGSDLNWRERALIGWVAPKGIVAAAISSLFALRLEEHNVPGAEALLPLTFVMIIGTVVIQSASAAPLARWLGISQHGRQGLLIHSANKVSIPIALALQTQGFDVLIADGNRENIKDARLAGLKVYFGNILSDHANIHLDTGGLNNLLLMDRNGQLQPMIFTQFRPEFGQAHIYGLKSTTGESSMESHKLQEDLNARTLFGDGISWSKLASLLGQNAQIKTTKLTDNFNYQDYLEHWNSNLTPLFAIDPQGRLRVIASDNRFEITEGWQVMALVKADA